jgi:hypothetical protein
MKNRISGRGGGGTGFQGFSVFLGLWREVTRVGEEREQKK